jgi:protein SCO1
MEYQKLILILAMFSAGGAVVPRSSMAHAEAMHHHEAEQIHEAGYHHEAEHHHHHAVPGDGYTRSVASYKTPDVKLVDANEKEVSLHDSLEGSEPVMLNFIFTTCSTICPVMSATFSQVQAKLGSKRKIRIISISIDPEHDTPSKLKEYAKRFEAGPQWSMLTGSIENSIAVQRAFEIYRGDKMNHEPVTFMRKGPQQPWVRINGFISADDLLREYDKIASN